jgi:hypothetical protein
MTRGPDRFALVLLAVVLTAHGCSSSGSARPSTVGPERDAATVDAPTVSEVNPEVNPEALAALRLHFATPVLDDGETAFPPLCPTGDDCFYSISVYADGHIALDDSGGRVQASLTPADAARVGELLDDERLRKTLQGPVTDCPGTPADARVYVATSARRQDGTEVVFVDAEGCVAGELTGLMDHPLYRLRILMNDDLRWRYAGCPDGSPATLDATQDASRRPLCRVGIESIVTR